MLKGFITLHVLDTIYPSDVGLDNNCTKEEFEKGLEKWAEVCKQEVDNKCFLSVNDIETHIEEE